MPRFRTRPLLTVQAIGRQRFWLGLAGGLGFAAAFYLASITFTQATASLLLELVTEGYASPDAYNAGVFAECERSNAGFGLDRRCPRALLPPATDWPTPMTFRWASPFWSGLSAALGQALTLAAWMDRPRRARPRGVRHVRSGIASGLAWVGLVPLVLGKVWFISAILVYQANFSSAAAGLPTGPDPFAEIAPWAALFVVLIALEPWRGLRRAYRCGWWPLAALAAVAAYGALLYALGAGLAG